MSSVTKRNLMIAIALLVATVAAFGYMLLVSERQFEGLRQQLTAIEKQRAQEASYLQMRRTVEESTDDIENLDSMFLKRESDSIDFLNLVESLAAENNVSLETKSLSANTDKKTKETALEMDFTFNGTRENVRNYVEVLEQLQYLAEITSLDLEARSSTNWQANVTVRINLFEYAE